MATTFVPATSSFHLPPVSTAAGQLAVDVQLVLVVANDVHLREFDLVDRERLAEVAVADRNLVLVISRRPDPVGVEEL
jgi:hypothetical protein